jgi:hypothetical protein
MNLNIMGDFAHHDSSVSPASKAWGRRSKGVHDFYTQCEASVYSHGQASCVGQFQRSVIARGFLREGADEICHAAQLEDLSEVVQHFYPERDLPTNEQEYKDKVRSFADIAEDPWFNQEGGLRSIAALIEEIPVGDHVLLSRESGCEDPWQGGWGNMVSNAAEYSGQVPQSPISAKHGWVLEQMSGSDNNARRDSMWDDAMTERERDAVDYWRTALSYVMTTQARHHGFPAPELDPTPTPGKTKLSIGPGGWTKLEDGKTLIFGRGCLSVYNARRLEAGAHGRKFHSGLAPYNERGRKITTTI